jgi:hypothetical protein
MGWTRPGSPMRAFGWPRCYADMSLNRAMVIGNLGGDPELRHLPTAQPVVGFSIATDESFTDKQPEAGPRRAASYRDRPPAAMYIARVQVDPPGNGDGGVCFAQGLSMRRRALLRKRRTLSFLPFAEIIESNLAQAASLDDVDHAWSASSLDLIGRHRRQAAPRWQATLTSRTELRSA